MEYEEPLLRVPLDALARQSRQDARRLEKEWAVVRKALDTLLAREEAGEGQGAEHLAAALAKVGAKLKGVKRKLDDAAAAQQRHADACAARARHAAAAPRMRPSALHRDDADYALRRCDRLLVDYLLRAGLTRTAGLLAEDAGLLPLCDVELFEQARPVCDGLRNGSCAEALAWCADHRARLRKQDSDLEFRLRVQECARLDPAAAVAYAREHLAPAAKEDPACLDELRRAVGAAVLCPDAAGGVDGAAAERYAGLRRPERWAELAEHFQRDFVALNGAADRPLLLLLLQAGLLSLNTGGPAGDAADPADPMACGVMRGLAEGLPLMTRKNSALVCPLSGSVMDDGNPPMVTPAGWVYSATAMAQAADAGGGTITCPRTGEQFPASALRKAFIL